ncbi:MAG: OmpA family protein, partial [Ruminococcus sp.]
KKILSIILCLTVITSLAVFITGCGSITETEKTPRSLSVVLGVHKYFPKIPLNTTSLYSEIYDCAYSWGSVSAVCVDGNPSVQCNFDIQNPDKNINESKKKQLAENNTTAILSSFSDVAAVVPEIDTLQAITVSADSLNSISEDCQKSMIIADSGLSTTGLLSFPEQNLIDMPADSIVEQLESKHALPNLSDINITWLGLGQVCGEQDNLSTTYKYKLQKLWKKILEAGGACSVTFDSSPLANEENDIQLPECSVIPIVADSLDLSEVITDDEIPEVIKFDDTSIQFKADKAEFINEENITESLKPIAEFLVSHKDSTFYVVGMTATVGDSYSSKELSEQRAEACRNILLKSGVDESQLICVGLGHTQNVLRVDDLDDNGELIEDMAQLNRAVFFIKSDSSLVDTVVKPNIKYEKTTVQ